MIRTGIEVIKIALHAQNEKKIPSPTRMCFKGTKFDPIQRTATTILIYPTIALIFGVPSLEMTEIKRENNSNLFIIGITVESGNWAWSP